MVDRAAEGAEAHSRADSEVVYVGQELRITPGIWRSLRCRDSSDLDQDVPPASICLESFTPRVTAAKRSCIPKVIAPDGTQLT